MVEEAAFPRLSSTELALVKHLARPCDYADGDVVFRAGQPEIDLYVVESGRMEIRNPRDGDRLPRRTSSTTLPSRCWLIAPGWPCRRSSSATPTWRL